jgi:hypothetical protein
MLTKIIVVVVMCLLATPLRAEESIFIESPATGTIVVPGQTIALVMRQMNGLPPVYFDQVVGLLPSPLIATQTVQSVDPYVVSIRINATASSGDYQIVGIVKRRGVSNFVYTKPILLRVQSAAIASISFPSRAMSLRFPGDAAVAQVDAYSASGSYIPLSAADRSRMIWSIDDSSVASVSSSGGLMGLQGGVARVAVTLDGLRSFLDVVVEVPTIRGDLNGDNVVDASDVLVLQASMNRSVQVPGDPRDVNGDGRIDALDLRVLTSMCSKPRCAI